MLNGIDTCTHVCAGIISQRCFYNVLLLELSVNFQRILSTLSVFRQEKHSFDLQPVLLKVKDTCIPWNNMIKVRSCSVLHITSL
jgi:hypothetical protein